MFHRGHINKNKKATLEFMRTLVIAIAILFGLVNNVYADIPPAAEAKAKTAKSYAGKMKHIEKRIEIAIENRSGDGYLDAWFLLTDANGNNLTPQEIVLITNKLTGLGYTCNVEIHQKDKYLNIIWSK